MQLKTELSILYLIVLCAFNFTDLKAQTLNPFDSIYTHLNNMLSGKAPINFKKTVFDIENTFLDNRLQEQGFELEIASLLKLVRAKYKYANADNRAADSARIKLSGCIFKTLTDTTFVDFGNESLYLLPYRYDFDDMFGEKDWSNMFVTKLLATHKGNCHSMPYLYKILCDELGVPCHLALAPNHIYIKHRSETFGWYNTELTSASFPIDAWLMASGYVSLEAVQNGIYMDALDDKKSLTLCVYDLAKGYDRKFLDNDGAFVVKCCDLALAHFPNFINALILKAETKKRQFELLMQQRHISTPSVLRQQKDGKTLWNDMNQLYLTIHQLGYRAMPQKMYLDWLVSLKKEKEKYGNKKMIGVDKD